MSEPNQEPRRFEPSARRTLLALAQAILPPGRVFPGAGDETIARVERLLAAFHRDGAVHYSWLLSALEQAPRLTHRGRAFSSLTRDEAEKFIDSWSDADVARRSFVLGLTVVLKVAYFDDPAIYKHHGCTWRFEQVDEPAPWMSQVTRGETLGEDAELECDAVVVGTGAGGAVVAKELAERGLAVLMLEEGAYRTRREFDGNAVESFKRFYKSGGLLGSIGNVVIPIPAGKLVGGSTAINTGTCWRTPGWVLESWVESGLEELSPDRMAPYFERVEREIEVAEADWKYLGGAARVIARGCEILGYSHKPVRRNAPGCDGSGICDFGCPTDARRSTNVSYVPAALRRGAELWTGVRAERVLMEKGRAIGLEARSGERKITIRARAVVLSCGTLATPIVLGRHDFARGLPQLGKNLTIHPATAVSALMDEDIRGYAAIPQGYCVDEFQRSEGILMLGASFPIDLFSTQVPFVGKRLMDLMENYHKVASFGVMVEDEARGRVMARRDGSPRVLYWLGKEERSRLLRGVVALTRIFLAAGAREVYPALHGHRVIKDLDGLERLARSNPRAHDWFLTAFHPLGTCRMATSPRDGVVSPDHEVFSVPGLYVVDGSTVPTAVAVNPQVTIMALATRAAEKIAARLEQPAPAPAPALVTA